LLSRPRIFQGLQCVQIFTHGSHFRFKAGQKQGQHLKLAGLARLFDLCAPTERAEDLSLCANALI
jgi:hypothetical protein